MKVYTSELLNLFVQTMNFIVEDIIDLLQDKLNLSSLYKSVFVISSSCFFKMLSSIFLRILTGKKHTQKKSMNMNIWVVGTLNQLFIRRS